MVDQHVDIAAEQIYQRFMDLNTTDMNKLYEIIDQHISEL